MKIRCAHLIVQLVVRQGRDVKGNTPFIIEVAPRYQRPHTEFNLCVGFFHILKSILKEEKFYDN
ncbi:hypothetical protein B7701_05250 [Streptococcus mitis]|uniref:Uncharacterized protein n=1 Tax=Streptococcus mitis TaxID=28037 RepID=A0AAX0NAJ5_STRMT|nr:hypothetical protein B7701_05250 [Streptococcus mitis]